MSTGTATFTSTDEPVEDNLNWLSEQTATVHIEGKSLCIEYGVGRSADEYVFYVIDAEDVEKVTVGADELRAAVAVAEKAYAAQSRFSPRKRFLGKTIDCSAGPLGVYVKKNELCLHFPVPLSYRRHPMGRPTVNGVASSYYNVGLGHFKNVLRWCDRHPQPVES